MRFRWISIFALALITFGAGTVTAQPDVRDHRDRKPPPRAGRGPREAPPPPKAETPGEKAGFAWITGRWDWRADKYEWIPGHWERERAGKHWRQGSWEKRGDEWAWTEGSWGDAPATPPTPATPPPGDERPRQPPPPPQAETHEAKAGFVWAPGEWDWRGGKYEWIPGHWERERAGKKWRPSRWELRDGYYSRATGDWVDEGAPSPAEPAPPGRPHEHAARRDWKIERPVVSSYWPVKGKPGSRIVIRGRNFPNDAVVVWGGNEIRGVKVSPTELRFVAPADAATGTIAIRAGRGRPLVVGNFEVAAAFDAEAERKRFEDEARKRAEVEWAARQKALAKDRAAREAAVTERIQRQAATREQRRRDRLAQIQAKYARAFLSDEETQAELSLHAQRIAELERMVDIAEIKSDTKLAVRVEVLRAREDERHDQRMAALDAAFRAGGGQ